MFLCLHAHGPRTSALLPRPVRSRLRRDRGGHRSPQRLLEARAERQASPRLARSQYKDTSVVLRAPEGVPALMAGPVTVAVVCSRHEDEGFQELRAPQPLPPVRLLPSRKEHGVAEGEAGLFGDLVLDLFNLI